MPFANDTTLRLQNLTDGETRELNAKLFDKEGNRVADRYMFADRLIAMAVDEDGDQLFGEMDREWLCDLPYGISGPLMASMMQHDMEVETRTIDELKKK